MSGGRVCSAGILRLLIIFLLSLGKGPAFTVALVVVTAVEWVAMRRQGSLQEHKRPPDNSSSVPLKRPHKETVHLDNNHFAVEKNSSYVNNTLNLNDYTQIRAVTIANVGWILVL